MIILLRCVFDQEAELEAASKSPGGAAGSLAAILPDFAAAPPPFILVKYYGSSFSTVALGTVRKHGRM